jgi:hypothetical protein
MDGSECSCGCSAFEDYCDVYIKWYRETYEVHDVHVKPGGDE